MPNSIGTAGTQDSPRLVMSDTRANSAAPLGVAACCLAIILALVIGVGVPDHLVLRHIVQTLPLWAAVLLGFRRSAATAWIALPFFLFWFVLMTFIWVFLLGIARIVTGTFTPLETAMTIVVGLACLAGIALFARIKSGLAAWAAASLFIIAAAAQWLCFRASLLPSIAHR